MDNQHEKFALQLTRELMDRGLIIAAGFAGFRLLIPPDAPEIQVREMRLAFMAGAQHLFSSILSALDAGADATEADMNRITLIAKELDAFEKELRARVANRPGLSS
jgi:hypothetical protein